MQVRKGETIRIQGMLSHDIIQVIGGSVKEYYNDKICRIVGPNSFLSFSRNRNKTTAISAQEGTLIMYKESLEPYYMLKALEEENNDLMHLASIRHQSKLEALVSSLIYFDGRCISRGDLAELIGADYDSVCRNVGALHENGFINHFTFDTPIKILNYTSIVSAAKII